MPGTSGWFNPDESIWAFPYYLGKVPKIFLQSDEVRFAGEAGQVIKSLQNRGERWVRVVGKLSLENDEPTISVHAH